MLYLVRVGDRCKEFSSKLGQWEFSSLAARLSPPFFNKQSGEPPGLGKVLLGPDTTWANFSFSIFKRFKLSVSLHKTLGPLLGCPLVWISWISPAIHFKYGLLSVRSSFFGGWNSNDLISILLSNYN
jgi:hypothetical protein